MLRLWAIVLTGNLVGTFLFALCLGKMTLFDNATQQAFTQIGMAHLGAGIGATVVRAIFAGWLIALMVWLLPAAESARVWIVIILTYIIGIGGFSHIVAGSTTMFLLVVTKAILLRTYFTQFFLPTQWAIWFGGISPVAALGHAQVVGG